MEELTVTVRLSEVISHLLFNPVVGKCPAVQTKCQSLRLWIVRGGMDLLAGLEFYRLVHLAPLNLKAVPSIP